MMQYLYLGRVAYDEGLALQRELVELLPGRPPLRVISSVSGHDGFLIEAGQIDDVIAGALGE